MSLHDDRLSILLQLERGELSKEEAARLLSRLDAGGTAELQASLVPAPIEPPVEEPAAEGEPEFAAEPSVPPEKSHLRSELWLIPFVLGLLLTLSAAVWMAQGWMAAAFGWGFWLSFIPLAMGVGLIWLGWETRQARWLHLRVRQAPGKRPRLIAISLPLPAGLLRWGMARSSRLSGNDKVQTVAQFIDEMSDAVAKDGPMHIYVDDDKDGDKVEIWIE